MSLINDVLRDLDRRHANSKERNGIPDDVRPLPRAANALTVERMVVIGGIVAASAGLFWGLGGWTGSEPVNEVAPPVVASAVPAISPVATGLPVQKPDALPEAAVVTAETSLPVVPAAQVVERRIDIPSPAVKLSPVPRSKSKAIAVDEKGGVHSPEMRLKLDADIRVTETKDLNAGTKVANGIQAQALSDDWVKAQTFLRSARTDEAEPVLRKLLEAQPALLAPRQALIGILLPARRYGEAMPVLKSGLALHPEQTSWAMNLARLNIDAGDYEKAWEALSVSLPHAQQQAEYLAFAGTILQRLERPKEAAAQYQAALRLRSDESRWWVGLGISLDASGHPVEAKVAYQRAKALGNFSPEIGKFIEQKLQ